MKSLSDQVAPETAIKDEKRTTDVGDAQERLRALELAVWQLVHEVRHLADARETEMPTTTVANEFLSVAEAAEFVGVSTKTIRRWLNTDELRAHGTGRVLRVRRAGLIALMERGRRGERVDTDRLATEMFSRLSR